MDPALFTNRFPLLSLAPYPVVPLEQRSFSTPQCMLHGPWGFDWIAGWDSATGPGQEWAPFFVFRQDGDYTEAVELRHVGGVTTLQIDGGSGYDIIQPLTFSAGQVLEFVINPISRTVAIFGATAGNGVFTGGATPWWQDSISVRIGEYEGSFPQLGPIGGRFRGYHAPRGALSVVRNSTFGSNHADMFGLVHPTSPLFTLVELAGATLPADYVRPAEMLSLDRLTGIDRRCSWRFTWTSSWASTVDRGEWPGAFITVQEEPGYSEALEFHKVGSDLRIEVNNGVTNMVGRTVTFSAAQALTITVNPHYGLLTVVGATTGDGTSTGNAGNWWPLARALPPGALMRVGDYFSGGGEVDGTFGDLSVYWGDPWRV